MWPLYRIILWGVVAAVASSAITGEVPPSIAQATPAWYDLWFTVAMGIGAAANLAALHLVGNLVSSLQLERVGCIILATVSIIYLAAVISNRGGPPQGMGTWMTGAFGVYCLYRIQEISLKAFGTDLLKPLRPLARRLRRKERP